MQMTDIPQQYTVKRAVDRLINRFKSDKIFIKQEDTNALKEIAIALNFFFSGIKKNDTLFYKLALKLMLTYMQHYKSWKLAFKQLQTDLEMPVEFYEKMILAETNSILFQKQCDKLGLSSDNLESGEVTHPDIRSTEISNLDDDSVKSLVDSLSGYTQQEVNDLLFNFISDLFIQNSIANEPDKH